MTEQEAFDRCKDRLREQVGPFVLQVLPMFQTNGWLNGLLKSSEPRTAEVRRLEAKVRMVMVDLLKSLIDHQLLPTVGWYTSSYSSRLEVVILRTERDGAVAFHGSMRVVLEEAVAQVRVE